MTTITTTTEVTTTPEETPSWSLTPGEWERTRVKISKVLRRARRRGFTGQVEVNAEPYTRSFTNRAGLPVTEQRYRVTITGTPPCYEGWTFLATLDWDASDAGVIVRSAPGVDLTGEGIDVAALTPYGCDHCRVNRTRRKTMVVRHTDGRVMQIGRTCLKDHLGWNINPVFLPDEDIEREIQYGGDEEEAAGLGPDQRFSTLTILTAAVASTDRYGFRPKDSERATRDHVMMLVAPTTREQVEEAQDMAPYFDEATARAEVLRGWLLSHTPTNDYMRNLQTLAAGEWCDRSAVGVLASAPQAKAKAEGVRLGGERVTYADGWFGQVDTKFQAVVTVVGITYGVNDYNRPWTLYTMVTADNHCLKWFSSRQLDNVDTGTTMTLAGTVKRHDVWEGVKQTMVTRCKAVS